MDFTENTRSAAEEDVFVGTPAWEVPAFADRYAYKKHGGNSDTAHQKDEFE